MCAVGRIVEVLPSQVDIELIGNVERRVTEDRRVTICAVLLR